MIGEALENGGQIGASDMQQRCEGQNAVKNVLSFEFFESEVPDRDATEEGGGLNHCWRGLEGLDLIAFQTECAGTRPEPVPASRMRPWLSGACGSAAKNRARNRTCRPIGWRQRSSAHLFRNNRPCHQSGRREWADCRLCGLACQLTPHRSAGCHQIRRIC